MVKIRKKILSPTAINTYLSCPHKYYLRYIKKLRTKPSIHLIRGQIVHKGLHEFHKRNPEVSSTTPIGKIRRELLEIFNRQWDAAKNSLNHLDLTDEQIEFYHDDSELMMLNFSHWFLKHGMPVPDLTEARIRSDHLGLLGIIDAVFESDEKVILVDYKTSKRAKITDDILRL